MSYKPIGCRLALRSEAKMFPSAPHRILCQHTTMPSPFSQLLEKSGLGLGLELELGLGLSTEI